MSVFSFRQQVFYAVMLYFLLLLLVPQAGYQGDVAYWSRWATYGFEHGLGNVYQVGDNNYNPLYHYILWVYGQMMGSVEKLQYYIHWLKGFTLLFDFAGAFWAASLVADRSRRFGLVLLLLLNFGYLYNTLIWIQVDSIYTFFSFGAVVLAVQRRPVGSLLCFVLAIAAKTQAIIFLPPLVLLWVPQWWHRPGGLVRALLAGAALTVLILAPFIWWSWENYLPRILEINKNAAGVYPQVSMNAYNIWYLITDFDSPSGVSDLLPYYGGLTYRTWGLIWFCGAAAVALLPLLVSAWQSLRSRAGLVRPDMALVMLSCGIIPLLFTFFNTQMHERYWHAAILFLAAYSFLRRDYLPFVLVSVAYGLHLERNLEYLKLLNYGVLIFKSRFIASLFAVLMAIILFKIYRLAPWRTGQPGAQPVPTNAPVAYAAS